MTDEVTRRFVPPLGWPVKIGARIVTPADRPPLAMWNRYPGQVIGVAFRLPTEETAAGQRRHKQLSLLWARPARWWAA